jgi:hypothetical protein
MRIPRMSPSHVVPPIHRDTLQECKTPRPSKHRRQPAVSSAHLLRGVVQLFRDAGSTSLRMTLASRAAVPIAEHPQRKAKQQRNR